MFTFEKSEHGILEQSARVTATHPNSFGPSKRSVINALLVTGGTGFIGGAVLAEIYNTPLWPKCLFMVRAPSQAAGRERIVQSIRRFIPNLPSDSVSINQVVAADLCDAESLQSDARLRSVSHVIHSAAVTAFSNSARIAETNVDGSLTFLRALLATGAIERFINVGTAWSVGFAADALIREGEVARSDVHLVPYTKSKAEFEQEARKLCGGISFISARPSIVVGHTELGTVPSGSIYWVFRSAAILGAFTCRLTDKIDVVPVDWVARSLLQLAAADNLKHDTYHLSSGVEYASTFSQIDVAIARGRNRPPHGLEGFKYVDDAELAGHVRKNRQELGDVNPWLLCKALSLYGKFARANTFFDNSRTLAEGIAPPPAFHAYADLCARTAEGSSLSEQMANDFK